MAKFEKYSGTEKLYIPLNIVLFAASICVLGYILSTYGLMITIITILFFSGIIFLSLFFFNPKIGLQIYVFLSFTVFIFIRYIPGQLPFGLLFDVVLLLTLLLFIIKKGKSIHWAYTNNYLMLISLIWMFFIIIQIFNYQKVNTLISWIYGMRSIALYEFLIILSGLLIINKVKDLYWFLVIWMVLSSIGTLKGLQQLYIGLDPWEAIALEAKKNTHLLFGKLRVFSFYSDAGQFGTAQALTATVAGIIVLGKGLNLKSRFFFLVAAILGIIGMAISGTRATLSIPAVGGFIYLLLLRKFKIFVAGCVLGLMVFGLLKYTMIGHSVYQINRMRTALNFEDPSLQVRFIQFENISNYLKNHPMGAGIGSTGKYGAEFSPNAAPTQLGIDSQYYTILLETGYIGLYLYICILLIILFKSIYTAWIKIKNKHLQHLIFALIAGYSGILIASLGNPLINQMPIGTIIYFSWVFIEKAPFFQSELTDESKNLLSVQQYSHNKNH